MEFEMKYDVGDMVYIMSNDEQPFVERGRIEDVYCSKNIDNEVYKAYTILTDNGTAYRNEKNVFSSFLECEKEMTNKINEK